MTRSVVTDPAKSGSMPPVLISAYAASPAYISWDPDLEGELLRGMRALAGVVGFEIPWRGSVHPHDPAWFLANVPAGSQLAFTALPYVMPTIAATPGYGVASADEAGRRAAIADLRAQAADVRRVHAETDATVITVSIHTAPRSTGSIDALAQSLRELQDEDWDGAQLIIEHCDAAVDGQRPEKGFLTLEAELAAIELSATDTGVWLNWGRSAIELREPSRVTAQIADAAASGRLRGLTFSGSAAVDGPYGDAWIDAHLPFASVDPSAGSLLGDDELRAALRAAGSVDYLGLKVSRRPTDASAPQVLATLEAHRDVLAQAAAAVGLESAA